MKLIKIILLGTLLIGSTIFCANAFMDAWDNTMTDEEIAYYLEKYPTEEKLIKLAERRNIGIKE